MFRSPSFLRSLRQKPARFRLSHRIPGNKRDWRVTKTPSRGAKTAAHIYIGVGGWTFAPWRGVFYPEKLTQAKELEYAASKLASIEINGTY